MSQYRGTARRTHTRTSTGNQSGGKRAYSAPASRVHAYGSIDRSAVFVHDASTPGSTFIAAPERRWTQTGTTPIELDRVESRT